MSQTVISGIACLILGLLGGARAASSADLLAFQATPLKGPECVTDTTGYFYAEDELNPDPATAMPSLSHYYLVVRNLGQGAVATGVRFRAPACRLRRFK